jgi:outer membrane protein OmpA-like peptidoglycan-associated protein
MKLSQARAESVKGWLVAKGIAAERITAKGYGPDKPVADNKTKEGRQKNRRIEFFRVK